DDDGGEGDPTRSGEHEHAERREGVQREGPPPAVAVERWMDGELARVAQAVAEDAEGEIAEQRAEPGDEAARRYVRSESEHAGRPGENDGARHEASRGAPRPDEARDREPRGRAAVPHGAPPATPTRQGTQRSERTGHVG